MGNDIAPGITLVDGQWVHDADLNALVGNATILPTAISARSLMSTLTSGAEFLVNDAGVLRKCTSQQIAQASAVPAGCMMDYAGSTEPLGWVFCYGQSLSTTTYALLFAAIGYTYGGSGANFNVPDCRGRVTAGDDNMGGTAANRLTTAGSGFDGKVLGTSGGAESIILTEAQASMPAHTHSVPAHSHYCRGVNHAHGLGGHVHNVTSHAHFYNEVRAGIPTGIQFQTGSSGYYLVFNQTTGGIAAGVNTGGPSGGSDAADRSLDFVSDNSAVFATTSSNTASASAAHSNTQPTIVMNKIIKT